MFDNEKFIEFVRDKPCLWDRRKEEYSQRMARNTAWLEIGQLMYDDWEDTKPWIIKERVETMKNRWRHIRDSFVKHINQNRQCFSGRKRRRYIYQDDLQFLLDSLGDDANQSLKQEVDAEPCTNPERKVTPRTLVSRNRRNNLRIHEVTSTQTESEATTSTQGGEVDAGELFLLSLLPDYQKLEEDEKLDFRVMCLQYFLDVRQNRKTSGKSNSGNQ